MRVAVFDVSNGSCALAVCPNGYSVMFDCGSHTDKDCPIDFIKSLKKQGGWLAHMKEYPNPSGRNFPLTKLIVSHPDLDHIRNIKKVHTDFTPYLLHRRYVEHFPISAVHQDSESYEYYRDNVCKAYRGTPPSFPTWGFTEKSWMIPMETLKNTCLFDESKIKNNSSIVTLFQYGNFRIFFCGDMEEAGWNWLIDNNYDGFRDEFAKGVDVIVASHHGHTSGYSPKLMNLLGKYKLAILSKGSESDGETDVDSRYSANASGMVVYDSLGKNPTFKYSLTTRSNGNIFLDFADGVPRMMAQKI